MKTRFAALGLGLSLAVAAIAPRGWTQDAPPEPDQGVFDQLSAVTEEGVEELKKQEGVEPQLKGPVHEAFAEAVTEAAAGPVVNKEPPADLEEMPAADKPEGEDVQWYSGYWEFDQDKGDFIWVSGIYRKAPPRRQWIAGSWVKVEGGWQRQRGMWMPLEQGTITFLSEAPPEPKVEEAASTPPDDNSFFIPGNWEKKETGYEWKNGRWVSVIPGWVWIPAHWVRTPCGWVLVPGYWDHEVEKRGVLYAPVCVDLAYVKPGWVYTPCCVVHNTCLLDALFVRPGCGYFFGSYYTNSKYICWPDACVRHKVCDPLFSYYKCQKKGQNFETSLKNLYAGRQSGKIASPPSNLSELGNLVKAFKNKQIGSSDIRKNLLVGSASKLNANVLKLTKLDNAGVLKQKSLGEQLRNSSKSLAGLQSQHLLRRNGSSNGGNNQVLKLNLDQSISSRFRSIQRSGNGNGNANGNGNGQNSGGQILRGTLGGNGATILKNNGNGGNGNGNGNGNGTGNSNGGNKNSTRILQGGGLNTRILQGGNNGAGNSGNNGIGNGGSSNKNGGFRSLQTGGNTFRSLQSGGSSGGSSTKIITGGGGGTSSFRSLGGGSSGGSSFRSFGGGGGGGGGGGRGRR